MKIGLLLFIIFFSSNVLGAITDYNIQQPIFLDQQIRASGFVSPAEENVICSFIIVDHNGVIIYRLTDEVTNASGFFSTSYFAAQEPILRRSSPNQVIDYNLTVRCNSDSATKTFKVEQRESIAFPAQQELLYATQRGNLDTGFLLGSLVLLILFIAIILFFSLKKGVGFIGQH